VPVSAGVRWQVAKETPINLRIDDARGKGSDALYISVGEAFWTVEALLRAPHLRGRRRAGVIAARRRVD
jgi:hypothetical protein